MPTAAFFAERGFAAFAVHYSCLPATFPQSLCEGLWAVRYLRENAGRYGIDPHNVTALGFSAGGHLAAMLSNLYYEKEIVCFLGDKVELARINAAVLSYPVITMGRYAHATTRDIITEGRWKAN